MLILRSITNININIAVVTAPSTYIIENDKWARLIDEPALYRRISNSLHD